MSIINRFTKSIEIVDYRGYRQFERSEGNLSPIKEYFLNKNRQHFWYNPSRLNRIQITDHALQRWNERVGPSTDKDSLEQIINALFFQLRCVEFISEDMGVIDDDIVFTFYQMNDSIVISTFYGRKSLNFILTKIAELRKLNKYIPIKIDLSIPSDVLESQLSPPLPSETMVFKGSWTKYYIEKYIAHGSSVLFVHMLSGEKCGNVIAVDVSLPPCRRLSKSLLRALHLMGYSDYVYQHIEHFKGEQLQKYLQKIQLQFPA
ncbi:hypothetical protein [Brevibacillus sp. FSL L8-0710]|uniref:hypothetical protein n=1 Tax=Brevibacillus sp. FSL L8-0710 TaxID=2975313 RepID=UPI0030F8F7A3